LLSREQVESWFWGVVNENKRLRERLEQLEAALRPFAEVAPEFLARWPDADPIIIFESNGKRVDLSRAHFDAARALLEPREEG